MRYVSTRGDRAERRFCEILLEGLAPDGGLYLPASYPRVGRAELDRWRALPYAELAAAVLGKFVTDIPAADIERLCRSTYTGEQAERIRAAFDRVLGGSLHLLVPTAEDFVMATDLLRGHASGLRAVDALHLAVARNRGPIPADIDPRPRIGESGEAPWHRGQHRHPLAVMAAGVPCLFPVQHSPAIGQCG